jgi:hypothetical protein
MIWAETKKPINIDIDANEKAAPQVLSFDSISKRNLLRNLSQMTLPGRIHVSSGARMVLGSQVGHVRLDLGFGSHH